MDALEELKDCARIPESAERIACYEDLGKRVLANDVVISADDAVVSRTSLPPASDKTSDDVLAADLGGDKFVKQAGSDSEPNRGLITSCRQGVDKKWFYVFDNGQIWKQSDGRRRRHKECHYYVTITKDTFGYKMQVDGEKEKIRIRRHR